MIAKYPLTVASFLMTLIAPIAQGQTTASEQARQQAHKYYAYAFKHPPTTKTIAAALQSSGQYSKFLQMIELTGMMPLLDGKMLDTTNAKVTFIEEPNDDKDQGGGGMFAGMFDQLSRQMFRDIAPYALAQDSLLTVFAPTNAAFDKLPKGKFEGLMKNPTELMKFVRAHIVTKGIYRQAFVLIRNMQSMQGSVLSVSKTTTRTPTVGGSPLVQDELVATNGVIHGLTRALPWPTTQ